MRDKKRIRAFCNRLAEAWECCPDLRFGQLMVNVFGSMDRDPFFPEDAEMIWNIERWIGANNPYKRDEKRDAEFTDPSQVRVVRKPKGLTEEESKQWRREQVREAVRRYRERKKTSKEKMDDLD